MNEILTAIQALLPSKRKNTPSGWISFNAVCCHHNGENRDTRQRGGLLFNNDDGFQYHCFNCNFKAGWTPGKLFSKNSKKLFHWFGMPDNEVNRLSLTALKFKDQVDIPKSNINLELTERSLPEETLSIKEWIKQGCNDIELQNVIEYIYNRGLEFDWYDWHWSSTNGYKDRLIIPFYFNGKIVGWTGRKITDGKPKYLTDAQPGYVFNIDNQNQNRKFVIVVEGQLDAIAIDGCAIMHNEPNATQVLRINSLGKEVIVVPDNDKPGAKMIQTALTNNWAVSLPPWESDIKDVADAVKRYGRLYALTTILHYRETNQIKIQLLKKKLENARNAKT